ncbi:FAD:protein FMN transferase [Halomonas sp. NCCP-2165]|nr:FAD:protein FMN transferase [Halomonas sp. NCCP-2165]GKW50016.1 FAD:protein FMN transferase [Halomonas sp. NCCP-2165]
MSPPSRLLRWALMVLLAVALSACDNGDRPLESPVTLDGEIFGTFYQVTIADPLTRQGAEALEAGFLEALEAVDASMSTYRDDAELVAFNRAPVGEWQPLSAPLMEVLAIGQAVAEASGGAFDMTVGGLVNLWSFGPEARPREVPDADELASRLAEIGPDKLELDPATNQARRLADVFVDLSGVAKGYATDRVAAYLEAQGIDHYLVNLGGDLAVQGFRDRQAQPWRIGVELPDSSRRVARHVLPLHDGSVATSGDYRNYFEEDGRRFSHTLDPRSGYPVTHTLASVSVFHPSNAWADAWATALSVVGPEEALTLAEREGLEVLLLVRDGEGWASLASRAFGERLGEARLAELGIEVPAWNHNQEEE